MKGLRVLAMGWWGGDRKSGSSAPLRQAQGRPHLIKESQAECGNLRDETGVARKRRERARVLGREGKGCFGTIVIGAFS